MDNGKRRNPIPAVSRALVVAILKAVSLSGSILLSQVISRIYGYDALGSFAAAMSAALLVSLIVQAGLPTAILRHHIADHAQASYDKHRAYRVFMLTSQRGLLRAVLAIGLLLAYFDLMGRGDANLLLLFLLPSALVSAWLQMRASSLRLVGRVYVAAVSDMSMLYLLFSIIVLADFFLFDGHGLLADAAFFAAVLALPSAVIMINSVIARRSTPPISHTPRELDHILVNSLSVFTYRNGYPLILAAILSAPDLGYFRVQERIAYAMMFSYFLFESLATKRVVNAVGDANRIVSANLYLRFLPMVLVPAVGLFVLLAAVVLSGNATFLGLDRHWLGTMLVFAAGTIFPLVQFNLFLLNVVGNYAAASRGILAVAISFFIIAPLGYQWIGLRGVEIGYFLSALIGCAITLISLMYRAGGRENRSKN